jgi:hypothetical protein
MKNAIKQHALFSGMFLTAAALFAHRAAELVAAVLAQVA